MTDTPRLTAEAIAELKKLRLTVKIWSAQMLRGECEPLEVSPHREAWEKCLSRHADALLAAVERAEKALRTRPDYDLRCYECGAPHNLDTSIPSEAWNTIAPDGGCLCTLCIDDKLAEKELTAEAEFYFVGRALSSRLYDAGHGELESLRRELAAATEREARVSAELSATEVALRVAGQNRQLAEAESDSLRREVELLRESVKALMPYADKSEDAGADPKKVLAQARKALRAGGGGK